MSGPAPIARTRSMVTRKMRRLGFVPILALLGACQTTGGLEPSASPSTTSEAAKLNTQLGVEYMRNGKLELAFQRLKRALAADPNYSTAHNMMGLVYTRLDNPAEAEKHFRRAVSINPTDSSAQTNYGSFLCHNGRYEEGEQRFLDAVKNSLYERPERAYVNAGVCMKNAEKPDKAETYFRQALEANPRQPSALINMAQLSFEKKRHLQARAYLQRYLEVAQPAAGTLWLGVRIERALGDGQAESEYARQLEAEHPDSPEVQMLLESRER